MTQEERIYEIKSVVKNMDDWYDNAIRMHERAIADLRTNRESFRQAVKGDAYRTKPQDVLAWLVSSLGFVRNNLREDMLVHYVVRLTKALG